ncbi:MAG: formyltetrahydrofolate deformylase, partial [Gammaproteobacteria bacterium]|nr:formyltetrahydrofolate deformylase [Gammaproteobacteria bacterium]
MNDVTSRSATLLIYCPDQKGIVISITEFIYKNGGNILYLAQHVDTERQVFFMRIEWDLDDFAIDEGKIGEYFATLVADRFSMNWRLHFSNEVPRMALFVSRLSHCFYDILARYEAGEWQVEIPLIISNHDDMRTAAGRLGIEYIHLPVTRENRAEQERKQLELLQQHRIDFIVLARYMQILGDAFINNYPDRIINIHHSFLPAFPGARPYHSAHERGVKIIGATSHYATTELDTGPIIEQDVVRVSHE